MVCSQNSSAEESESESVCGPQPQQGLVIPQYSSPEESESESVCGPRCGLGVPQYSSPDDDSDDSGNSDDSDNLHLEKLLEKTKVKFSRKTSVTDSIKHGDRDVD